MKLLLDDILDNEIKEYLQSQYGINVVEINKKDFKTEVNIEYDNNISSLNIMKHIDLFMQNKYSIILEFNKGLKEKNKLLKYVVDDICCEYCYKSLVKDLFEKQFINSVKSNADFNGSVFEVNFEIGYINYTESELIEIIKECL